MDACNALIRTSYWSHLWSCYEIRGYSLDSDLCPDNAVTVADNAVLNPRACIEYDIEGGTYLETRILAGDFYHDFLSDREDRIL